MDHLIDFSMDPDGLRSPFPVPNYRFDQKNDVFKRVRWEEKMIPYGRAYYIEAKHQDKAGYTKIDYAFHNAAWDVEAEFGMGNSRSNYGLYAWDGIAEKFKRTAEPGGPVRKSPQEMSRIVKKAAHFFGADLVGICRVHPNWVYSHEFNLVTMERYPVELRQGCQNAIVMAIAMDEQALLNAPTAVAGAATGLGYSKMAFVARMLAVFIRGIGFQAIPSGNDTALSIPLAIAAGMGEGSRMGLLLTEKFGPRVRICKVFTDLPLECDTYQPFGAVEFCKTCRRCSIHCPSQAIPHSDMTTEGPSVSNHSGILKWYLNPEKCFAFWAKNMASCSVCIRVCPFNKPPGILHTVVRSVVRRTPKFNRLFVWTDNVFRYGKGKTNKYWP
jgi:reductive dehalogenase